MSVGRRHRAELRMRGTLEEVWAVLANPSLWPQVNPQIRKVSDRTHSVVFEGEEFLSESQSDVGDEVHQSRWVVREVVPQQRVVYHAFDQRNPAHYTDIGFVLTPEKGRTVVQGWSKTTRKWHDCILRIFFLTEGKLLKDTF